MVGVGRQFRVLMLGWEFPPRFAGGLGNGELADSRRARFVVNPLRASASDAASCAGACTGFGTGAGGAVSVFGGFAASTVSVENSMK